MAKSRQQRRARRAARAFEPAVAGSGAPPAPPARRTARAGDEPERRREPHREAAAPRGSFVRESYGELRKVEWPNRPQVMAGTIVVIIACAIVGAYLWLADQAFKNLVEKVLI